ncbi:MAG TPA: HlyD family efflux transporter periplasmic adaptor subunit [Stenotrophomonas sp.]|nr:HlyD family efflux transporter periplasmic adaptor subunit [Stenotrophomonas sp.]
MTNKLFRREVAESRMETWLGEITLLQPLSDWVLALTAGALALIVMLGLWLGSYTHRSSVRGQLLPAKGVANVVSPSAGVVSKVLVAEGRRVTKGEALAIVSVPSATLDEGDTGTALQHSLNVRAESLRFSLDAKREQLSLSRGQLEEQWSKSRTELSQIESEILTRRRQVILANEVLGRWKKLQESRYVSALQIAQQESSVLEYTSQMQALQRRATELQVEDSLLAKKISLLPSERADVEAAHRSEMASLEQERLQLKAGSTQVVIAPAAGTIASQMIKAGQSVQLGQVLLSILPEGDELEAELLVGSRDIGFVEVGDRVFLRYQAFPYQKFGHQPGRVRRISRTAIRASEIDPSNVSQSSEPQYLVTVSLTHQDITVYGRRVALQPGMLLDADILGEKRRLMEWIMEPLYSMKDRVGT